jgi:integrase
MPTSLPRVWGCLSPRVVLGRVRSDAPAAELPKIRLHDSRHTALSQMEKAGVPISIISKWAGHYDAALTMKTYVHASDEDLKEEGTKALAKLHKIKTAWNL